MKFILNLYKSHPILSVIYLLLACLFFRIIDIFVLRMDEVIGEVILSKTIGFILVILFLVGIKKKMSYIYMHKLNLNVAIRVSIIQVLIALTMTFGIRYLFIMFQEGKPYFDYNNEEYTFLSVISFVIIGNIINTLMEEGLFRGILLRTFMTKTSFLKANLLQSFIFGLWHITWTIKQYTLGELTLSETISNSILYTLIATIMGFIMGYMIYKTKSIWTPIIWHTLWNITMNLLLVKSHVFNDDSDVMNNSYVIFWFAFLIYSIISFVITKLIVNQKQRESC